MADISLGGKIKKRRPGRFRVRSIRVMAEILAAHVVELGEDEHCVAALITAGFNPKHAVAHFDAARDLARTARMVEREWLLSEAKWR